MPIKVDPGQMEQVLMNLVVNARDAMPQGGKLTIATSRPGADPHALLAVTDTGVGMSEEVQARLFEPFFTTKEPGKGTGLGLSTVYGIVQQSQGHIRVASKPGQGTSFGIFMPLVRGAAEEAAGADTRLEAGKGSETILLVEDEAEVRALARKVLQENGYQVLEADNGVEALTRARNHRGPIHLVVTDVVMPLLSGTELVERLSRLFPRLRVLLMSGYNDSAMIRHGVEQGRMAFLPKPFNPADLIRAVRVELEDRVANETPARV